MKRILWVLTALLLVAMWSFGQADKKAEKKAGGVEQALMDIERKWAAAGLKNDTAVVEDILADNWSAISPEGKMETRAQAIDETI